MKAASTPTGSGPIRGSNPRRAVRAVLAVAGLATLMAWWGREPLQSWVHGRALLANEAPSPEALEEFLGTATDPGRALAALWNSGGLVHREAAVRWIVAHYPRPTPLPAGLEAILFAGAGDADLNVREAVFSALAGRGHPAAPTAALRQLEDADPEVRRLGLEALRRSPPTTALAAVVPRVADLQPEVAALAVHVLGRHGGVDFDVKLSDGVAAEDPQGGGRRVAPEGIQRIRVGAERARAWWEAQGRLRDWPAPAPMPDVGASARPLTARDFVLPDLEGRPVRLSTFRGRVVLLNFWATWCTACAVEVPALTELQRRHPTELVILGISLDGVQDSHGHAGGHGHDPGDEGQAHAAHGEESPAASGTTSGTRDTVRRFVQRRGIGYRVLLDERNAVGARFNGGELPTHVWIDGQGMIRRRFVGARSLETLEAMLRATGTPFEGGARQERP